MSELLTDSKIQQMEKRLSIAKDLEQRLFALADLARIYTFTNISEAQKMLDQEFNLLKTYPNQDLLLQCRLHQALVENQLYNYDLSDMHFRSALKIVEATNDIEQKTEIYIDYAGTLMNLNQYDRAIEYLNLASDNLVQQPNAIFKARLSCREAYWSLKFGALNKAAQLFFAAEQLFSQIPEIDLTVKDQYFRTLIYAGLGGLYSQTSEREKSVKSYLQVVNLCETIGMKARLAWHYVNVGKAYMEIYDYVNAEFYLRKATRNTDDMSQSARASASANLGYCLYLEGNYDEALELYNLAERLWSAKDRRDDANLARVKHWKAKLYDAYGEPKKSDANFAKALEYAGKANDFRQKAVICGELAKLYAEKRDFKNAFEYQVLHDQCLQRYLDDISQARLDEVELRHEAERKRQEAEKLKLEATSLQLKALRAQMNPHFMFNALNAIQEFIYSGENEEAATYLSRFSKLMRQSLEYSELEIIALEDEIDFLKNYLELNAKLRFGGKMDYQIEIDDDLEEDLIGIPTMIIQPYLENAIEHGLRPLKSGGQIKLYFGLSEDEESVFCIVEDNGVGRKKSAELQLASQTKQHKSRGTAITQKRLEILNARHQTGVALKMIDLADADGKPCGTRIEINIPIVDLQKNANEKDDDD
ncbi:MAG: hypothetical protein RL757_1911 [Bacteroidota bacterium]|jgi:hypothetical protein